MRETFSKYKNTNHWEFPWNTVYNSRNQKWNKKEKKLKWIHIKGDKFSVAQNVGYFMLFIKFGGSFSKMVLALLYIF